MNFKRKLSALLILSTLLSFSASGCKEKEPDPLPPINFKTVPVKVDNELARQSIADTAVRFFYLVNYGEFEKANELVDRTDLSICTPEILQSLYSRVENYSLGSYNRVVGVNVNENIASLTFINMYDDELSFDKVYEESEYKPYWLGMTVPYVSDIQYATTYELWDINDDGEIDETDMMWEDNPELNPDYEPEESTEYTDTESTSTGTAALNQIKKTTSSSAKDLNDISEKPGSSLNDDDTNNPNNSTKLNEASGLDNTTDVSNTNTADTSESVEPVNNDVLPVELTQVEEYVGYKTYQMDITVTPYDTGFKVKLPDTMTTNTVLEIKIPDDMYIKIGDLELNKSYLQLDETYGELYKINKLPKVEKFSLQLGNKIMGLSEKEIDLTKRVFYIYSNILPTYTLKEQVLQYAKPMFQTLYDDLLGGVKFEDSNFYKNYVSMDGEVSNLRYYYNKYQLEASTNMKYDYEIVKVRFPENGEDDYTVGLDYINANMFRVTSYYYIDVPVVIELHISTYDKEEDEKTMSMGKYSGIIRLTKDYDKWSVWDISRVLLLYDS